MPSSSSSSWSYTKIIFVTTVVLLVVGCMISFHFSSRITNFQYPISLHKQSSTEKFDDDESKNHEPPKINKQDSNQEKDDIKQIIQNLPFKPIAPSLENAVWAPTVCMPGTILSSSKFLQNCKQRQIVPAGIFCPSSSSSEKNPLCGQYSSGTFLKKFIALDSSLTRKRQARRSDCLIQTHLEDQITSADWYFEKDRNLLASRTCEFQYLAPQQLFSILVNAINSRTKMTSKNRDNNNNNNNEDDFVLNPFILFSGDSMMRQIFLRVISLLRGQLEEPLVEHYFHFDTAYVVVDGKYDAIVPLNSAKTASESVSPKISAKIAKLLVRNGILSSTSEIIEALISKSDDQKEQEQEQENNNNLVMLFQWETKPSKSRNEFLKLKPAVHVVSWMYWWQKKDPLSDFDLYSRVVDQYFQKQNQQHQRQLAEDENVNASKKSTFVYISTPWTREGVFGGVDDAIRISRNRKIIEWLRRKEFDGRLVDFSAIADLKKFSKTKDEIHYMCIWQPKLPGLVNEQKFVADNKCVDKMNAAVAQVLVQTLI